MKNEIGNAIRAWRKHKGMTLTQLSDITGINNGNLSKIERDEQGITSTSLTAIAGALDVTLSQLFTKPEQSEPAKPDVPRDVFLAVLTGTIANPTLMKLLSGQSDRTGEDFNSVLSADVLHRAQKLADYGMPQ